MAMPCCGISKKVTSSLPSSPADADDTASWARKYPNVPAASRAAVLSTAKKFLLPRPPVLGATRVRENWSRSTPNTWERGAGCQHGGFAFLARLGWRGAFLRECGDSTALLQCFVIDGAGEGNRTLV